MTLKRLICLSVLMLTASITVAFAQNTSNPMTSGNTTNPALSGNTVAQGREAPVSEHIDWNECVYRPSLHRATNNRQPDSNSVIPEPFGPPASSC